MKLFFFYLQCPFPSLVVEGWRQLLYVKSVYVHKHSYHWRKRYSNTAIYMSLEEWKLLYVRICVFMSWYHSVKAKSAGGGNIEQWLFFFFFFCKETNGKHLNNSWRSNWFFWLEGLAPFDLSSPEEKLINTEVWGVGCACVHMYTCIFSMSVHVFVHTLFMCIFLSNF